MLLFSLTAGSGLGGRRVGRAGLRGGRARRVLCWGMPGVGVESFRLSSGWIGSGLVGLCDGGRRHVMASGWLGGNSGRCVVCSEAVCWQQTFSAGWEECVYVGGVGKISISSPHVVALLSGRCCCCCCCC